jgi:hypothetical protein
MNITRQPRFCCITRIVTLTFVLVCVSAFSQTKPDFGANVLIFDSSMPSATIQSNLDVIFARQSRNEFGTNRYAIFFKPGQYLLDINVGFYTQVLGLGQSPDDVSINGSLHAEGRGTRHIALINFTRGAENLAVIPTNGNPITWAVSQGTSLRRIHIKGTLNLANTNGGAWSSGGFLADSKIDSTVNSLTQQQWLSRNDTWGSWTGHNWNMVFVGVSNPPSGIWPDVPYTVITNTPLIREKPYLSMDNNGKYIVMVPGLQTNSVGTTWTAGPTPAVSVPIDRFYVAQQDVDNAATINAALSAGKNLLFAPGIYHLTNSILVTRPDTIIIGLGCATLIPDTGTPAMVVADVGGVKLAGLIFDAGAVQSPSLLLVGITGSSLDHSSDPIFLYDIVMRVGGATSGTTTSCLVINANNVVGDNFWLWRADHGRAVDWHQNACNNGLVVNGNDVTIYGLFVEHHEQYQTLWNGNGGRVYFYQCELPYDAPAQNEWSHDGVNGYAAYKVADSVTNHQAYGLGIYGVFTKTTAKSLNAIETPATPGVSLHHAVDIWITGQNGTEITHLLNRTGNAVNSSNRKTTLN